MELVAVAGQGQEHAGVQGAFGDEGLVAGAAAAVAVEPTPVLLGPEVRPYCSVQK